MSHVQNLCVIFGVDNRYAAHASFAARRQVSVTVHPCFQGYQFAQTISFILGAISGLA